jgi:hypothetical protein
MPASIVKVYMPNRSNPVNVRFNEVTRRTLNQLSRSSGSYIVRDASHEAALTPHIVQAQGLK